MLMHTRGILVMTPASAMVLTGKQALDFSGGVSAEDNFGIGGFDRDHGPERAGAVLGADASRTPARCCCATTSTPTSCPGERFPRRTPTADPREPRRPDVAARAGVRQRPHRPSVTCSRRSTTPSGRSRSTSAPCMRAVTDADAEPLERWTALARWRDTSVVWDAHDRRHPGLPARAGVARRAAARVRAGRRAVVVDLGHPVPAVVPQDRPGRQRGEREPARSWCWRTCRASTGRRSRCAAGSWSTARRSAGRSPTSGPDRVRGGLPLPRRRVRGVLQAAQPVAWRSPRSRARTPRSSAERRRRRRSSRARCKTRTEKDPRVVGLREEPAAGGTGREAGAAAGAAGRGDGGGAVGEARRGRRRVRRDPHHPAGRCASGRSTGSSRPRELRPYVVDALERGMARAVGRGPSAWTAARAAGVTRRRG